MAQPLECDYLIVGSGAMGMAMADVLLTELDATIAMVDRHHRAGGHWNDAYSFVRLHQPSKRYGINSRELGSGLKDATGLNRGFDELASGAQVLSYFDDVMQQQFLPTGRLHFFPMSEYQGEGRFRSLVSGTTRQVQVRRKTIDTTFCRIAVPSTHPPQFEVAPEIPCLPLNELPRLSRAYARYVVVGSGKTGIDAVLWLLENDVDPASIHWVMPRDAWLLNRENVQTDYESLAITLQGLGDQVEAIRCASTLDDLFLRLEAAGQLLRIDPSVMPTMYRCATVTRAELAELRRVRNIVRLGRVRSIDATTIVLDRGTVPAHPDSLYVHCSARAITQYPPQPVFTRDTIKPQCVRACQPIFSAAFIAHIEATQTDDQLKNELCGVVPLPELPIDWLRMLAATLTNQARWSRDESIRRWLVGSRLDGMAGAFASIPESDTAMRALLQRYRSGIGPAMEKLRELIASYATSRSSPTGRFT